MQFTVPQFIEMEPKIVGPLTLRQFFFLAFAGGISFFLYYAVPFFLFLILCLFLFSAGFAFAFLKINSQPLPTVLINFFKFSYSGKNYFWQKKTMPPKIIKKERVKEKEEETVPLKIVEGGKLKKLSTLIEIKTR
ncbi:MAG: PrgI family protein [Candidatus Nealsonbacteria bacterium]|nr:PrgI family protein [Candidatus Nealsonbacteria bacterium]